MRLPDYKIQDINVQSTIPWNIEQINAPSFWIHSQGEGVNIAIIDTGLDVNHPEFRDCVLTTQNFTGKGGNTDVTDNDGHGTHVAGIIAGKTTGVAPEARIIPLKVFGDSKVNENIREAFKFVLDWNKRVSDEEKIIAVNCSFGGAIYDSLMAYYIRSLVSSGVAVIVAAGNSGDGNPETHEIFSYPAYIYEVITTGAMNQDGQFAGYSNSFDGIDLGAPGTKIYSAWPDGGYRLLSGTSMAAPHVTGAYALIAAMFRKREGRWPTTDEGESILFNHIRKVDIDPFLAGQGVLDLTYSSRKWPLYRVQLGAFYYESGAVTTQKRAIDANLSTYIVKY